MPVEDAKEAVQEAACQLIQAGFEVDANAEDMLHKLLEALGSRINGLAINRRRKKAAGAVGLTEDGAPAEPAEPLDAERQVVDNDLARRTLSQLLERTTDDQVASSVLILMSDGVDEPAEQAKALGCDVREIYKARRRLSGHFYAIGKLNEGQS